MLCAVTPYRGFKSLRHRQRMGLPSSQTGGHSRIWTPPADSQQARSRRRPVLDGLVCSPVWLGSHHERARGSSDRTVPGPIATGPDFGADPTRAGLRPEVGAGPMGTSCSCGGGCGGGVAHGSRCPQGRPPLQRLRGLCGRRHSLCGAPRRPRFALDATVASAERRGIGSSSVRACGRRNRANR